MSPSDELMLQVMDQSSTYYALASCVIQAYSLAVTRYALTRPLASLMLHPLKLGA